MKVRPTGGSPYQVGLKPAGKIYKQSSNVGMNALKNARYLPKRFTAENKSPDKKLDKRVAKAAFGLFRKANTSLS